MRKPASRGPRQYEAKWLMAGRLPPGGNLSNDLLRLAFQTLATPRSPSGDLARAGQKIERKSHGEPLVCGLTRPPCSSLLRHLCEARFSEEFLYLRPETWPSG